MFALSHSFTQIFVYDCNLLPFPIPPCDSNGKQIMHNNEHDEVSMDNTPKLEVQSIFSCYVAINLFQVSVYNAF